MATDRPPSRDHGAPPFGVFERRLLESARLDDPAPDWRAAWARFAALAPMVSPSSPAPPAVRAPVDRAPAVLAGSARRVAAKWLLVGAICGGGIGAALSTARQHSAANRSAPVTPLKATAVVAVPAPEVVLPRLDDYAVAAVGSPGREEAESPVARPYRAHPRRLSVRRGEEPRASRAAVSTRDGGGVTATAEPAPRVESLAAEVSRIDAARAALAAGDPDEAIRLVTWYHRDFPDGALAADAEVVALEATAANRDRAELSRRAAEFLSRHPGDPHAARVRALMDR